jgi:hypothetical protein
VTKTLRESTTSGVESVVYNASNVISAFLVRNTVARQVIAGTVDLQPLKEEERRQRIGCAWLREIPY